MSAYSDFLDTLTPVGYWPCSEASGDLVDASGNGNDMAAQGSATYGVPGAINTSDTAIRLSGADANYFVNAGTASLGTLDDSFTLMGWFKRAELGRRQMILAYPTNGPILEIKVGNTLALDKNGTATSIIATTRTVLDSAWHFAVAMKAGNGSHALYLDGVNISGTITDATCATADTDDLAIGKVPGFNSLNWNGDLAHLAVVSGAVSAANITRLYQLGRRMFDDRRRRR